MMKNTYYKQLSLSEQWLLCGAQALEEVFLFSDKNEQSRLVAGKTSSSFGSLSPSLLQIIICFLTNFQCFASSVCTGEPDVDTRRTSTDTLTIVKHARTHML